MFNFCPSECEPSCKNGVVIALVVLPGNKAPDRTGLLGTMQTGQLDSANNIGVVTRSLATLNQGIIHNKQVTVPCLVKLDRLSPSTKKIRVRCRNGYYTLVKDNQFYKIEESRLLRTRNRSMSASALKKLSSMNRPDPRKGGRYVPFQHGRANKRPFVPSQQEYSKQHRYEDFDRSFSGQSRDVRGEHEYSTSRNSWQGRGQYRHRETRGHYDRYRPGYRGHRARIASGEFHKSRAFGSSMDKRCDSSHRMDNSLSHGGSNRSFDIEHEHKLERKRHSSEQSHQQEKQSLAATYRQNSSRSAERSLARDSSDPINSTEQSSKDLNKNAQKHKSGTQEAEAETSAALTGRGNVGHQFKTVSHKSDQNPAKLQSSHEPPLSVESVRDNDNRKKESSGDTLPNGSCSNLTESEVKVADSVKCVKNALPTNLDISKEGSIPPGDSASISENVSVNKKKKKSHGVLTMAQQIEMFKKEKKSTSVSSLPVNNQTKLSSSLPSNKNDKLDPHEPGNQPSAGSETEEKVNANTKSVSESTNKHKDTDCQGSTNSGECSVAVPSDSSEKSKSSAAKGSPKVDKQQKMAVSPMRDGKRVYSARKTAPSSAVSSTQRKEMLQKQAVLKAQQEAESNCQNLPEYTKNARIGSPSAPSDDREPTAVSTTDNKPVSASVVEEDTVSDMNEDYAFTPPKYEDLIVLSDTEDGRNSPPSTKSGSPPSTKSGSPQGAGVASQEPAKELAKDDNMKGKERAIMKIKESLKYLRKIRTSSPGLPAISRPETPEEVEGVSTQEVAAKVAESSEHSVSTSGDDIKETPKSLNTKHIPKSPKANVTAEDSLSGLVETNDDKVSMSASSKGTDISDSRTLSAGPVEKELTSTVTSNTTDCAEEDCLPNVKDDCVANVGEETPLENSAVIESSKTEQVACRKEQPQSPSALVCSSSNSLVHEPLKKEKVVDTSAEEPTGSGELDDISMGLSPEPLKREKVIDTSAEEPIDSGELSDISMDLGVDDPNDMDVESADDDILLEDEGEVVEDCTPETGVSDGTPCEVPHVTTTEAEQEKSDSCLAEKGCSEENKPSEISDAEDIDMPSAPAESPQDSKDVCMVTEQAKCVIDSVDVEAKQSAEELSEVPAEEPTSLEDTPETLVKHSLSSEDEVSTEGPCAQESSKAAAAEETEGPKVPAVSSSATEEPEGPKMPSESSIEQDSLEESSVAPGQPSFQDISETPNEQPECVEDPSAPCVMSEEKPCSSALEKQDSEENVQSVAGSQEENDTEQPNNSSKRMTDPVEDLPSVAQNQEQNDTDQPNSSSKRVRDAAQKLEDAEPASKRTKTDNDGNIQGSNSSSASSTKEKSQTSDAPVVFTAQEWKEFSQSIRDKYEKLVQTFNQKTSAVNEANFRWQQETLRLKKELAEMTAKYSQLHSKLKQERTVSSRSVDVQTVTYRKTRLSRRKKEPLKHTSQGTDVPANQMEPVSGTAQNMQSPSAAGNNSTTSGATSECPPAQGAALSTSADQDKLGVSSAPQGNPQTTLTGSKPGSLLQAKRSSFSATLSKAIQSVKNCATSSDGSPSPSAQKSSLGVINSIYPDSSDQQSSPSSHLSPQQTPGSDTGATEQDKITPTAGAVPQDQEKEINQTEKVSTLLDSKAMSTSQESAAKPDEMATCGPNAAVTASVKTTSAAQQQSTPSASIPSPSPHPKSTPPPPPQSPSNAAPTKAGPDSAAGSPKGSPARKSPSDGANADQSSRPSETEVIDLTDDPEPIPAPSDKPGSSTSVPGISATPSTMRHATLTTRSPHALVSAPPVASAKATPASSVAGQRTLTSASASPLPGSTMTIGGTVGAINQSAVRPGLSGASGSASLSTSGNSVTTLKSVVLTQGTRVSAPAVVQKPPNRTVHSTANPFPASSQLRNVNPPSLASAQSLAPIVRSPVVSLQHGQGQKLLPSQVTPMQITAPIQIQPGVHTVPPAGLTTAATFVSAPSSQQPAALLQAQAKMQQQQQQQQRMASPQQLQQQQISLQMLQQQRQTIGMHQLPGVASSAAALATRQPQSAWLQQINSVRPGGVAQQAPRTQAGQVQQPSMLTPTQIQLQMIRAQNVNSVTQTAPFSAIVPSRPQAQGVTQVAAPASTVSLNPTQDQIYAQMVMNQAKAKANALREQQQQQQQREQQQQQQARLTAAQQQSSRINQQQAQRSQLRKMHDDKLEHQQQAQQNQALKRMITSRIVRGEEFQRTLTEKLRDMKQKGINTQLHHSLEQQLKDVKDQDKKLRAELKSVDEALRLHQRLNEQLDQQLRHSTGSSAQLTPNATPSSGKGQQQQQLASKPKHPAELPDLFQLPDFSAARHLPQPLRPILELKHSQEGIVLSWKMNQNQPANNVEVKQYLLYSYQESEAAAPSTELWKKIGAVKALSLPMACTLTQFKSGTTYHFAVCAVSKRDCPGQFSNIGSINLP